MHVLEIQAFRQYDIEIFTLGLSMPSLTLPVNRSKWLTLPVPNTHVGIPLNQYNDYTFRFLMKIAFIQVPTCKEKWARTTAFFCATMESCWLSLPSIYGCTSSCYIFRVYLYRFLIILKNNNSKEDDSRQDIVDFSLLEEKRFKLLYQKK